MDTYFAPPDRTSDDELIFEIDFVSNNPVVSGLLHTVAGMLAVLNENRQIIALNNSFLQMLGIDDPMQAFGLRLGETLQCIHKHDEPAGCGTTKYCSTCGAAVAIVASLGEDKPVERICALTVNRGGKTANMALLVRSHPIKIEDQRFILLFLQDISQQQQRAALERTFYHDVNNMLTMLVQASEHLVEDNSPENANIIHLVTSRLLKEVSIQRSLSQGDSSSYQPMWHEYATGQIVGELRAVFSNHPAARERNIDYPESDPGLSITTDISLLIRVLSNMIINALEATEKNGMIRLWLETNNDFLSFCVWNEKEIPKDTANRIFQRNFSTKGQDGRGIGTYSMKLFGEEILGGEVSFTSSEKEGTVFRFSMPV